MDTIAAQKCTDRKVDDTDRFNVVMSRVVGKRLTYRQLCGMDGCGFMGIQ